MLHFSSTQLAQYLKEHQPFLLDVREKWEFDLCRIEDSQLIPMHQIPNALDEFDHNQEIVLICHHGIRSRQVGLYLEANGFNNLINLTGGVAAWARDVDTTMATY